MSKGTHETEIKLALKDARSGRKMLRDAGFVVSCKRVFEANTILDTPELGLRSKSCLLRLREAGPVATVTYKGVPEVGRHKSREELEVRVTSAVSMLAIGQTACPWIDWFLGVKPSDFSLTATVLLDPS